MDITTIDPELEKFANVALGDMTGKEVLMEAAYHIAISTDITKEAMQAIATIALSRQSAKSLDLLGIDPSAWRRDT